jgi:hypothetical protein
LAVDRILDIAYRQFVGDLIEVDERPASDALYSWARSEFILLV